MNFLSLFGGQTKEEKQAAFEAEEARILAEQRHRQRLAQSAASEAYKAKKTEAADNREQEALEIEQATAAKEAADAALAVAEARARAAEAAAELTKKKLAELAAKRAGAAAGAGAGAAAAGAGAPPDSLSGEKLRVRELMAQQQARLARLAVERDSRDPKMDYGGGSYSYYDKYMKYKSKYIALRSNLL